MNLFISYHLYHYFIIIRKWYNPCLQGAYSVLGEIKQVIQTH